MFDLCAITASDETQARVYRQLIERRVRGGLYPREIRFEVFPDPPNGRVGSGGATLHVLSQLLRRDAHDGPPGTARGMDGVPPFAHGRILILHAGGESRRLPAYGPEGKLFAPVPSPSSSRFSPVILDHLLTLFLKYPWREGEILVTSGDVIIDFATDLLDLPDTPICGFAALEPFSTGSHHGVFVFDSFKARVLDYYQKASADFLAHHAVVEGTNSCAVDIGLVSLRGAAVDALLAYGACANGGDELDPPCFDIYLELLTACLGSLDYSAYASRVGERSRLGAPALKRLYAAIHGLELGGVLVKQSSFIHFGSLGEYGNACRQLREEALAPFYGIANEEIVPEISDTAVQFNCENVSLHADSGDTYAESCRGIRIPCEGGNVLVGVRDLTLSTPLPRGICVDERDIKLREETRKIRLVYGSDDSFKPCKSPESIVFCGLALPAWLRDRRLTFDDIRRPGETMGTDLYSLSLFVVESDISFLEGYWKTPAAPQSWAERFRAATRLTLHEVNQKSCPEERDEARAAVRIRSLAASLPTRGFAAVSAEDFAAAAAEGMDRGLLLQRYRQTDDPLLRVYRGTLLRLAGVPGAPAADRMDPFFSSREGETRLSISLKLDQIVWARAPVRFDLAGGWTDTPPFTNRFGGAVVNAAMDLNGQSPIQVFIRRTSEPVVRFHSIDLGVSETVKDCASLRDYRNPASPFSLPRAALVLLGLGAGAEDRALLGPLLARAGGGLEITLLCAVPKGSGLGTSSILAGVILAALKRFFGLPSTREDLFLQVLEIEQMLTTGGGWQDQIGGLIGGVKYIESRPSHRPRPVVHQLDSWLFESPESVSRMTLFYTGQTRLAKGLLQDVVDGVNGMSRAYLFTHERIRSLAASAREAIALRDTGAVARIIAESMRENILIHPSTTNPDLDRLLDETRMHWSGMKLLGAGGGGFALFISPSADEAARLRGLLSARFDDDRARLVDFSLNKAGLEVTVS
jgi:galactokinase/mevalonate kinase-like predicted kinase